MSAADIDAASFLVVYLFSCFVATLSVNKDAYIMASNLFRSGLLYCHVIV